MNQRPPLNKYINLKDFREFYWLKEELLEFCRKEELKKSGGKIELTNRIEIYLKTGKRMFNSVNYKKQSLSKFDWNKETLTLQTKITDNYKNTSNVRSFFTDHIGKQFKFNVKFMNWMKTNTGKILEEAISEWKKIKLEKGNDTNPKEIAPQFEYNRYIRDFLKDNPKLGRDSAIKYWKIKKSLRGDNIYRKSDLDFKK
jgi:hypothetical protein